MQRDRQPAEEQRQHEARADRRQHSDQQAVGLVGRPEAEEAAAQHHPLDAEVEQAGPLGHRLADPGHDQRHRPQQAGREQDGREIDDRDAVDRHAAPLRPSNQTTSAKKSSIRPSSTGTKSLGTSARRLIASPPITSTERKAAKGITAIERSRAR